MTAPHRPRRPLRRVLTFLLLLGLSACKGWPGTSDPVRELAAEAASHRDSGEYTAAEDAYQQAFALTDDHDELRQDLAELYLAWGRPHEGLITLDGVTSAFEASSLDARVIRARLLAADGQWAEAITAASAVLAEAPQETAAWQVLVQAYLALHECERAEATARRAMSESTEAPAEMLETALLLAGDYGTLAQHAPDLVPDASSCRDTCDYRVGLQLIREQEWALAACLLEHQLASVDGQNTLLPEIHAWLGEALIHIGRSGPAAEHLRAAVELAPKGALPWLLLGKYGLIEGDFELAQTALYNAHQFDPENPAPCLAMAELYAAQGLYVDATTWIDAALERAPFDPGIWVSAARFYLKRDLASEKRLNAITEQALVLAPDDPDVLVAAAWHRLNVNDVDTALDLLERALEAAPNDAEAHYLRAMALQKRGAFEEADAALTRAADLGEPRAQR